VVALARGESGVEMESIGARFERVLTRLCIVFDVF